MRRGPADLTPGLLDAWHSEQSDVGGYNLILFLAVNLAFSRPTLALLSR
jgi:hypothetical protein